MNAEAYVRFNVQYSRFYIRKRKKKSQIFGSLIFPRSKYQQAEYANYSNKTGISSDSAPCKGL